ncbi:MAG: hypothetical protein GY820_27620 [Gammaproteobacteria bacterium]|nr:hypothetical protein [Gammaproteobacteria bacterium]
MCPLAVRGGSVDPPPRSSPPQKSESLRCGLESAADFLVRRGLKAKPAGSKTRGGFFGGRKVRGGLFENYEESLLRTFTADFRDGPKSPPEKPPE